MTLAQDAGSLIQILGMVVAYTEGSSSQEIEIKNIRAKLAATEKAVVDKDKSLKLAEAK